MRTGLLLVLVLAACGGGTTKPASDPATASLVSCDQAATHVGSTAQKTARLRGAATYEALVSMVSTRCTTDAWADETKQCLFAINRIRDARKCTSTMTDAQREAIKTDARALRKDAAGPVEDEDHSADWLDHVVEEPAPKPATTAPAS
jgi:hypothetical protein